MGDALMGPAAGLFAAVAGTPPDVGVWSVLPPLLAIALAIRTRQVHLSLFVGIWLGWTMLAGGNPLTGLAAAIEGCVTVLGDAGNARVVAFSALVGALVALTRVNGGVDGFVGWVTTRARVDTPRRARMLSWGLGVGVFVESSITSLVNGAVCRPIFDRLRLSREKLAYLCDSTAAPVCILLPLNAWGAYLVGLLEDQQVELASGEKLAVFPDPVGTLLSTIPLNFYAIVALALSLWAAWTGFGLGRMRAADARADSGTPEEHHAAAGGASDGGLDAIAPPEGTRPRALNLLFPVLVMVGMMPLGLFITGDGDMLAGSGSTSVLWAVLAGIAVAGGQAWGQRTVDLTGLTDVFFRGFSALVPVALLMVLAFAIGDVTRALGTGKFVGGLAQEVLAPALFPAVLFVAASFVAFATGTSWGTFAIMIPIAVPMAYGVAPGLDVLAVAAVMGGGIFGDHCSPISDTTIIASLASGCDHVSHVTTQLPYALLGGGIAAGMFGVAGLVVA